MTGSPAPNSPKAKIFTAQGVAFMRARETIREPEESRLVEDPYARLFFNQHFESHFVKALLDKVDGHGTSIACRTRFIDDCILDAVHGDAAIRQLVICGAGCDMRAFRLALPSDMVVIEIDLPDVQSWKQDVVKTIDIPDEHATTHYLPVDFNTQSLADALDNCFHFRQGAPTIWILEGVSMYISKDAIADFFATASRLSGPQSRLLFTYLNASLMHTEMYKEAKALVERQGEPFVSTFYPDEMQRFVAENSAFTEHWTDMGSAKYNETYLQAVGRARKEGVNFLLDHCVCVTRAAK